MSWSENYANDDGEILRRWAIVEQRMGDLCTVFRDLRLSRNATEVARAVALVSASDLDSELRRRRLPPYRSLRNWYLVVVLIDRLPEDRSLCQIALNRAVDPSTFYRLARGVTGHTWTEVRALGPLWCRAQALSSWSAHVGQL